MESILVVGTGESQSVLRLVIENETITQQVLISGDCVQSFIGEVLNVEEKRINFKNLVIDCKFRDQERIDKARRDTDRKKQFRSWRKMNKKPGRL